MRYFRTSLPGLTRQSMRHLSMDTRVKPAYDEYEKSDRRHLIRLQAFGFDHGFGGGPTKEVDERAAALRIERSTRHKP